MDAGDPFHTQPADYAEVQADAPRLPLLTTAEARLVVEVLLESRRADAERLGRDIARRIPGE